MPVWLDYVNHCELSPACTTCHPPAKGWVYRLDDSMNLAIVIDVNTTLSAQLMSKTTVPDPPEDDRSLIGPSIGSPKPSSPRLAIPVTP